MKLNLTPDNPHDWARRLHVLAHDAGLEVGPGSLPPWSPQAVALAGVGPSVVRMAEQCQENPEALRWLAVALRFWSERVSACADRTDEEVAEAVARLVGDIDAG